MHFVQELVTVQMPMVTFYPEHFEHNCSGAAGDVFDTFVTCSGHGQLDTKWEHSWSCLHDFQTSVFNKQDEKSTTKMCSITIGKAFTVSLLWCL